MSNTSSSEGGQRSEVRGEDLRRGPAPHPQGPALPCWRLILSGDTPNSLAAFSRASASLRPLTQYRPSGSCHRCHEYAEGTPALPDPASHQGPNKPSGPRCAHLPGGNGWVADSDEVGWDAMAPPQLPGDAPVPAEGVRSQGEAVPGRCAQPSPTPPSEPTHRILSIQACHVRWWASGRMRRSPRATAALAARAISPQRTYHCGRSRGSTTSLDRLQDTQVGRLGGSPLRSHPPFSGPRPHLQSGTTMGLSWMPRNRPRSFNAASTAFRASNLGRPWGNRPRHGCAAVPRHLRTWPHIQAVSPGKGGAR